MIQQIDSVWFRGYGFAMHECAINCQKNKEESWIQPGEEWTNENQGSAGEEE